MKDLILKYLNERIGELDSDWAEHNSAISLELKDLRDRIENVKL